MIQLDEIIEIGYASIAGSAGGSVLGSGIGDGEIYTTIFAAVLGSCFMGYNRFKQIKTKEKANLNDN